MTERDEPVYRLNDLLYLMARLRDPRSGCPWDLKQTYQTVIPHTLEEVYEVVDAIERGDFAHLSEELGDLLFQVVFYSQLAQEEGIFDFAQVVNGITRKLVRRHPHVFPEGDLYAEMAAQHVQVTDVRQRWEALKAEERAKASSEPQKMSLLDDVPHALPALSRAGKLQKRAAQVGFDWSEERSVLHKIHEELGELVEAVDRCDQQSISEEIGDLLFTVVNFSRHVQVDPESALRAANRKFERRFRGIECILRESGRGLADCDAGELDRLWNEVKQEENNIS